MSSFISDMLKIFQQMKNIKTVYLAEGKLFSDLLDARGHALLEAVTQKRMPNTPLIVAVLGEDNFTEDPTVWTSNEP